MLAFRVDLLDPKDLVPSDEVHARFALILGGERGTASEHVQCGVVVTLGAGTEGGELQVREVSLQVEDMEGMHLNGKDSLVRGLVGRRRCEKYLERKKGKEREEDEDIRAISSVSK